MRIQPIIILTAAVLLLNSCGIYKNYKVTDTVPENIFGTEKINKLNQDVAKEGDNKTVNCFVNENIASLGNIAWKEVFTDPHLQVLIERGLENNTDLLSAQERISQAGASLKAARLAYLPSFAIAPQGTISSFDNSKATQAYTLPLSASWEIDAFGRIRNAKKQSQALYAQSQELAQAIQTQVIAGIANTYYTLLMLDRQLSITETTCESWKESVETTRALKEAGFTTEAALAQTEAMYYNVNSSVLDLKEQINQVENSLSLLLAETTRSIARGTLENQTMPTNFSVGIPLALLANRPDVRSAELALEQAFYGTAQARSAFYPSIVLSGSAGWTNNMGMMITNPASFIASAIANLTQPLFNKGQNVAQLKIAKSQQEEKRLAFEQTLLNAGSEVNNAIFQYQTAQKKTTYINQQVASLERAVESTSLLMQHGTTTYLEVLAAKQTYLNAQLAQVANQVTEIQSVITLYKALGGGRTM